MEVTRHDDCDDKMAGVISV